MRTAPAVSAALDTQGFECVVISGVHALAATALAAWMGLQAGVGPSWPACLAGLAWIGAATASGAWLARRALPADGAHLIWDGASWALITRPSSGATPTSPTGPVLRVPIRQVGVALDLGAWMLLRLQTEVGPTRWQVVRAVCVGPAWHGLRLALLTQAGPAVPQPARPAPDRPDL